MLILTSVASLHLAALVGVLSADTAQSDTLMPPMLSGVLLPQPAAQATVASAPVKTQTVQQPKPDSVPAAVSVAPTAKTKQYTAATTHGDKPPEQPLASPAKAEVDATANSANEDVATAADPVAPSDAANDMPATRAVPVSAPLLNASAQFNAPPRYPQLSRKLREQGAVVLELTVLANGKVADVSVQQSSGYPRLDSAALRAVKHWQYQPAQRAGKAINYRYRQRLEFSLTEGVK